MRRPGTPPAAQICSLHGLTLGLCACVRWAEQQAAQALREWAAEKVRSSRGEVAGGGETP